MSRPFLTRSPKPSELEALKKFLASYRDGSGNNRELDGSSRADSRQLERCFAELLHGKTTENKSFYDFVVESNEDGGIAVRGASIKSKQLKNLRDYRDPQKRQLLRAHLELSNSSARDWKLCNERGLTSDDFKQSRHAEKFGDTILRRQIVERLESENRYLGNAQNKSFVLKDSVYISVLYSTPQKHERTWLISAFSVDIPSPHAWKFREQSKSACLLGLDAEGEVLYEWYALSGGQFKYYPRLNSRLHGTDLFEIPKPAFESLGAKVSRLFGD